jgi:hypothetical protein
MEVFDMQCARLTVVLVFAATVATTSMSQAPVILKPVRAIQCSEQSGSCQDFDALVFVHGIYGNDATFKNEATGFDWPAQLPNCLPVGPECRRIDVFRLDYRTALLAWASRSNPSFEDIATAMLDVMKPLRKRQYRSIGFIAHSLGGNLVSTYIHMVNNRFGHPQRAQNAFVITLATPVLGSQVANLASVLKEELGMNDPLLTSLEQNNLYLSMLNEFSREEDEKAGRYLCRPVDLHAAYEERYLGPLLIVGPQSAAIPISATVSSPIIGFPLNHLQIAKPKGLADPVYEWVMGLVTREYVRLASWDESHRNASPQNHLCGQIPFIPES